MMIDKPIAIVFLLVCIIVFYIAYREPSSYSTTLSKLADDRLRDTTMSSGLSIPELHEGFKGAVTVTPSEAIYRKMTLYYESPSHVSRSLSSVIPEFYPIDKATPLKTGADIITSIENNPNSIAILSDESYHNYALPFRNPKTPDEQSPIRQILTLGVETPTLLLPPTFRIPGIAFQQVASKMYPTYTPDWYDLQLPDSPERPFRIGTTSPTSSSHRVLQKILDNLINYTANPKRRSMRVKPTIVAVDFTQDAIEKAFQDNRIDAYFILCAHPNTIVYTLTRDKSYQLMGLAGIDPVEYNVVFPRANPVILNTVAYPSYRNVTLRSMEHPLHVVAHQSLAVNVIYTFIQSVFENFLSVKSGVGITDGAELFQFRTQMSDFSPSYLYPRYKEFALHRGVDSYFRDIGVITTNPAPECGYTVGISDCKKEPYFNPYRIVR